MQLAQDESDAGPPRRSAGLERLCVVTRAVRPVSEMVRFVVGPDETVVPDVKRRLPGRGVWVTASRQTVAQAAARNAFARGFRRAVRVPADLAETTGRLLERAALDALSIAHKAGLVETGFSKAEAAIDRGRIVAAIHASDGAADGSRKLDAAAKRRFGDAAALPGITTFSSAQLDLALGRSNVVHAALLAGPASETFLARHRDLLRFWGSEPEVGAGGMCGS